MNISELYRLTDWIETEIVDACIEQHYQALHRMLQQHLDPTQPRQSFSEQREQLIASLLQVPLDRLSRDQQHFLAELGIAQAVGEQGVAQVEDTLYKNVIDVATSAQTIGLLLHNLQQGVSRSSQIRHGLQGIMGDPVMAAEHDVLMRISFAGRSAMANVADFKHWGELWHDIGYGIAFAHNESIENVNIVGASSGSLILELGVSINFASTAGDIILAALQLTEKVHDINQKAEELRRLQLNNKLIMDLEKEAEHETRSGVETISATIIQKLGLRKNGEGDKITALMKAVKHLIYFLENGGDVDFVMVAAQHEADDQLNCDDLCQLFQQVRLLKKRLLPELEQASITRAA